MMGSPFATRTRVTNMTLKNVLTKLHWATLSLLVLLAWITLHLLLIALFNDGLPNHLLTPFRQYTPLLGIIWDENPFTALQIFATKSLLAITHLDARSGLNVWTYELDSITSMVYLACAAVIALGLKQWARPAAVHSPLALASLWSGAVLLATSVTYMSSIDHCSGPTWVGFVTLYGLGMEQSNIYLWWQIACAALGVALLGTAATVTYRAQKN